MTGIQEKVDAVLAEAMQRTEREHPGSGSWPEVAQDFLPRDYMKHLLPVFSDLFTMEVSQVSPSMAVRWLISRTEPMHRW